MVLTTEKFADLARLEALQAGLAEARIVSVAHPIGGTSRDELESRADAAVAEVMSRLLGR